MSGGVPAGERREQIADIIADHVSGPVVQDWDIQQAHRQDQLTAADKIAALFPTPTPPIDGRDGDVERDVRIILQAVADAYGEDCIGSIDVDIPKGGYPRQWLRDAARAALQALGER